MVVFSGLRELGQEWKAFRSQRLGQLFLLLLLSAVVYQIGAQRSWVDTEEYLRKAESLFSGWKPQIGDRVLEPSRRTPAFGLILMAVGPWYAIVSGIATLWFILNMRRWVREMSSYERSAEWATVFFMLHPLTWIYAVVPMPELWCSLLLVGWLRAVVSSKSLSMSIHAAALLAFKPVFVLLIPLNALAALLLPGFHRAWKALVVSILAPVLVYAGAWLMNKQTMGVGHYSSMGVSNALEYNLPAYEPGFDYEEKATAAFEAFSHSQRVIREVVWQNPLSVVGVHLRGIFVGLLDPGRYDLWSFLGASGDMGVMKALNEGSWPSKASLGGLLYMILGTIVNMAFLYFVFQGFWPQLGYRQHLFFLLFCFIWLGLVGPVASARYTLLLYPFMALWFADGWQRTFRSKT
ncbi:MAG: hypothetical protein RL577_222 [Bacteroidota bacterium]